MTDIILPRRKFLVGAGVAAAEYRTVSGRATELMGDEMVARKGNCRVKLDRPLDYDQIAIRNNNIDYILIEISPDEMASIRDDPYKSEVLGTPMYFAFRGDVVYVWPTPDKTYEVVFK